MIEKIVRVDRVEYLVQFGNRKASVYERVFRGRRLVIDMVTKRGHGMSERVELRRVRDPALEARVVRRARGEREPFLRRVRDWLRRR